MKKFSKENSLNEVLVVEGLAHSYVMKKIAESKFFTVWSSRLLMLQVGSGVDFET